MPQNALKLVTYNIKSGVYHPDGLEAIARLLEPLEPDVVALQEVDRNTLRSEGIDQAAWLADRLGLAHHRFAGALPWKGGGEYGLALLSVDPLEEPRTHELWVPDGKGDAHGEFEPRIALSASVRGVRILVTHLGLTEEQRLRQAGQLRDLALEVGDGRVAVTGDLNGVPSSPEIRLLASSLHDVLGHLPAHERLTFPSGEAETHQEDFLARAIDYIFIGTGLEARSARVIADHGMASDHNPCEAILLHRG